jgi:hypothetical protein
MRSIFVAVAIFCACLLGPPAAAQDKTSRLGERTFSFLNFWRPQLPAPTPPGRGARGAHANTSCLPANLKMALASIQARFGPVTVISTHRPGSRIGGGRPSLHASCQAVDFKPAPGIYGRVAAHLRTSWNGGLGTYSSGHIHIDAGQNLRWHSGSQQSKR